MPRGEHYAATKAGLSAVVRSLAVEYGRYGIRANAVLPGWIETAMTAGWMSSDRFRDAVLPRVPAGRWGAPEDFSGIAVYLASDASRYHSGDTIVIDGAYRVF
jgi:NAD(P)-dependent dehydrogenase (short-subunit alcohol dehydrogenase family)